MKITLQAQYKSIHSLNTEDLPDFAVLIGSNGSGTAQLLSALAEGVDLPPLNWSTVKVS